MRAIKVYISEVMYLRYHYGNTFPRHLHADERSLSQIVGNVL